MSKSPPDKKTPHDKDKIFAFLWIYRAGSFFIWRGFWHFNPKTTFWDASFSFVAWWVRPGSVGSCGVWVNLAGILSSDLRPTSWARQKLFLARCEILLARWIGLFRMGRKTFLHHELAKCKKIMILWILRQVSINHRWRHVVNSAKHFLGKIFLII